MNSKVESFDLDHTKVVAPYLRVADKYEKNGQIVTKFDIRICQPNKEFMETGEIHTFEHLFAVESRNEIDNIIDFSPMGCRTGFYLTIFDDIDCVQLLPKIKKVMLKISAWYKDIPANTEKECGNYKDHNLYGAKQLAIKWLSCMERNPTIYN